MSSTPWFPAVLSQNELPSVPRQLGFPEDPEYLHWRRLKDSTSRKLRAVEPIAADALFSLAIRPGYAVSSVPIFNGCLAAPFAGGARLEPTVSAPTDLTHTERRPIREFAGPPAQADGDFPSSPPLDSNGPETPFQTEPGKCPSPG